MKPLNKPEFLLLTDFHTKMEQYYTGADKLQYSIFLTLYPMKVPGMTKSFLTLSVALHVYSPELHLIVH
ncbi:hypothetical protein [Halobacillus dabanensis]|uniref:hypothetical protein n=1 Tax=Halobacillus dabanensis TaxID=240302 RepID=UPI001428B6AD|nr:hypothetical protein [Halobacillus dabanensis]